MTQPPFGPPPAGPVVYGAPPPAFEPGGTPPPAVAGQPASMPPGAQPPPIDRGTDGVAILALILGLLGGALLAVVAGIVALGRINRTGQRGTGMAVTGIVLGVLSSILVGIVMVTGIGPAVLHAAQQYESGATRSYPTMDLQPGDCLDLDAQATPTGEVPTLPCAGPHEAEVAATYRLAGDAYPGEKAVNADAAQRCPDLVLDAVDEDTDLSGHDLVSLGPTSESWLTMRDRTVLCVVVSPDRASGSVLD